MHYQNLNIQANIVHILHSDVTSMATEAAVMKGRFWQQYAMFYKS